MVDLTAARKSAESLSALWGLQLGAPFALSNTSYVVPVGEDRVLKVPWGGDDESLHEGDVLELWDGDGAVRLLRRSGVALLEERALPGSDISHLGDEEATDIAVNLATRLWLPARSPFRPVGPEVVRWLNEAEREARPLASLTRVVRRNSGRKCRVARSRRLSPSQRPSLGRAFRRYRPQALSG